MAKGDQRKEKMAKKPKKDTSEPKNSTSDRPMAPMTAVVPRGKIKAKERHRSAARAGAAYPS